MCVSIEGLCVSGWGTGLPFLESDATLEILALIHAGQLSLSMSLRVNNTVVTSPQNQYYSQAVSTSNTVHSNLPLSPC